MGASGWWYRCEHRGDVSAALRGLQQQVFAAGDYYKMWEENPDHLAAWADELAMMAEAMPDQFPPDVYDQRALDGMRAGGDPATIEQARMWAVDSGTHSILDIDAVRATPEMGAVSPLGDAETDRLFGTSEPTVGAVEAARDQLCALPIGSWTARYVVGFEDGRPAALFFVGHSGD